ncbi:MAG TPA: hypothetical protein VJR02_19405, partial [Pyrinomonadaceae bacterium]|nr:hypothetical protein [Pyrinomonadaceae bacterium]
RRVSLGNKIHPTLPRYGTDLFQAAGLTFEEKLNNPHISRCFNGLLLKGGNQVTVETARSTNPSQLLKANSSTE